MTTSRNNTIMSWMAYTEFFYPGCELQPGYFYLSIPELYYIPEDGACIGAAGVDAYMAKSSKNMAHLKNGRHRNTNTHRLASTCETCGEVVGICGYEVDVGSV